MPSPEIILKQLGGAEFAKVTGAHSFVKTAKGLQFSIPIAKAGINKVVIDWNPGSDNYDVSFWKIRLGKNTSVIKVNEAEGIFSNGLRTVFERNTGLTTRMPKIFQVKSPLRRRGL